MIKKIERVAMLYDFYGQLLTPRQKEILSLYYEQDLSLGEISEEYKISRQAVHDILKRSEKILQEFEEKLGLIKKFNDEQERLYKVLALLDDVEDDPTLTSEIRKVINEIIEIQDND